MDAEQKFKYMTEEPIPRLVCSLAVPTIISMLITSFYNMVDTFFCWTNQHIGHGGGRRRFFIDGDYPGLRLLLRSWFGKLYIPSAWGPEYGGSLKNGFDRFFLRSVCRSGFGCLRTDLY